MNHSYMPGSTSGSFSILSFLNRISTGRLTAFLFIAALATFLIVNLLDFPLSVPYMQRTTGHTYLDMQQYYNADDAYQLLQKYGEEGRKIQLLLLPTIDLFLPFILGIFGAVTITFLFRKDNGNQIIGGKLAFIALFAWFFDYAENFFIFLTVVNYPYRVDGIAQIAGILTLTKTILYNGTLGILLIGLIYQISSKTLKTNRSVV